MSEPQYLQGDTATFSDTTDGDAEVECDCGYDGYIQVTQNWTGYGRTDFAEWQCPNCNEWHTYEAEYSMDELRNDN
jgi:hypothetical protein